tara:strand:+ start:596 stop:874 length:279 start_codon:yes stop_codon:yes gene_type:complete
MPKYVYRCPECEECYEVVHSFGDVIEHCSQVNEQSQCSKASILKRVPQNINLVKKIQEKEKKAGHVVEEYIQNTKREIKEYKKEMKNWKPKK